MRRYSPQTTKKKREQLSSFTKAIGDKINQVGQKLTDPFASKMVVDNKMNPDSAWSKMKRATDAKAKLPPNFSK